MAALQPKPAPAPVYTVFSDSYEVEIVFDNEQLEDALNYWSMDSKVVEAVPYRQ